MVENESTARSSWKELRLMPAAKLVVAEPSTRAHANPVAIQNLFNMSASDLRIRPYEHR
jgi:hypothetical protein